MALLEIREAGLYCAKGDFYIDPWKAVEHAVTTHAHSDHARAGSRNYLCAADGVGVLLARIGNRASVQALEYGASVEINGVRLSLHPAGHVLGSAQVRVESGGEVWVVSGDYKVADDPTCRAFEPVRCHTFVTECTFGLPIYRWPSTASVFQEIHEWWRENQAAGCPSVLTAYPLGKAQRLLSGLDPGQGPIFVQPSVATLVAKYREAGVRLPEVRAAIPEAVKAEGGRALIIASAGADESPWLEQFGEVEVGFASGWMRIRGMRRWRSSGRGFVLSDHADWPGLIGAIRATGAQRILPTHGYTGPMVRWLREQGLEAEPLQTRFVGEQRLEAAGSKEAGLESEDGTLPLNEDIPGTV